MVDEEKSSYEDVERKLRIVIDETKKQQFTKDFNPEEFDFSSTKEVDVHEGLEQIVGQENAKRAVLRNLKKQVAAYNCMTQGAPGVGKSFFAKTAFNYINDLVVKIKEEDQFATIERTRLKASRENPKRVSVGELALDVAEFYAVQKLYDQVSLFNFRKSTKPLAVVLPQGYGKVLEDDMLNFVRIVKGEHGEINPITGLNEGKIKKLSQDYNKRAAELDFKNYEFRVKVNRDKGGLLGGTSISVSPRVKRNIAPEDKDTVTQKNKTFEELVTKLREESESAEESLTERMQKAGYSTSETIIDKLVRNIGGQPSLKSLVNAEREKLATKYSKKAKDLNFKEYEWDVVYDTVVDKNGNRYKDFVPIRPNEIDAGDSEVVSRYTQLTNIVKELKRKINKVLSGDDFTSEENDTIQHAVHKLKHKWGDMKEFAESEGYDTKHFDKLLEWFTSVGEDVRDIEPQGQQMGPQSKSSFDKYEVNVLVDNSKTKGVPVVVVENPSIQNLFGTAGHDAYNFTGEHTRLKAGAFMEANGGMLFIDEGIVALRNSETRDYFLTILQEGKQKIGGGRGLVGGGTSANIESEAFDAAFKLVMNSNDNVNAILHEYPQIRRRFEMVLFENEMPNSKHNREKLARFCADVIHRYNSGTHKAAHLPPLSKELVSYLVHKASAMTSNPKKLTNALDGLEKTIINVAMTAKENGSEVADIEDAKYFLEESREVNGAIERRVLENILNEDKISVNEYDVGRLNGLVVMTMPTGEMFGAPERIEATVARGEGSLQLSEMISGQAGDSTKKGFLVGETYIKNRYGGDPENGVAGVGKLDGTVNFPIALMGIDGNSASGAGVLALISHIAHVPLYQGIAVTGAIVGHEGEIGRIGGVYEKARGFYNICKQKDGLDGKVGVLVPKQNQDELLLKLSADKEMIADVEAGNFNLYWWNNVDDGLTLLTEMPAADVHDLALKRLPQYLTEN